MEINYQETSNDLLTRIRIHETYGARNIDQWNTEVLQPTATMKILDVGCGAGKQCFLYSDFTDGKADITGTDFSEELLDKAREKLAAWKDKNIKFSFMDFNKRFPFEDNTFDLLSSAFAIYYASDLDFTFSEAHRVLRSPDPASGKSGGRLFVTGPLPENKQMFYEIVRDATNRPIPPMPGSSRFKGEIYNTIKSKFAKTELLKFENPITFPEVDPFIEYVRASLSEDRKLWTSMFNGKQEYEVLIGKITDVATRWLERDGKLVMTKVVGGILATK